jgi:type III secretion protein L
MKFFSLLYSGELHTSGDEKLIPKHLLGPLLNAEELLEKIKEERARMEKESAEKAEELFAKAKEEGHQAGLIQFNEHLLKFEKQLKQLRHEMHLAILPLALKAAKKIVAKELAVHPETIVDIVLQTLAPVTQSHRVKIWANKSDLEHLEANRPRIKEHLQQLDSLSIMERADVSPGGCVIETESGIINATIENQWRALEAAFEKYAALTKQGGVNES